MDCNRQDHRLLSGHFPSDGHEIDHTCWHSAMLHGRQHLVWFAQNSGKILRSPDQFSVGTTSFIWSVRGWRQQTYLNEPGLEVDRQWGNRGTRDTVYAYNPASSTDRRGFTMHEHLASVSMVHKHGRVYEPGLARFISADPIVSALGNLQSHNRSRYVRNNPLRYSDPTGFSAWTAQLRKDFRAFVFAHAQAQGHPVLLLHMTWPMRFRHAMAFTFGHPDIAGYPDGRTRARWP